MVIAWFAVMLLSAAAFTLALDGVYVAIGLDAMSATVATMTLSLVSATLVSAAVLIGVQRAISRWRPDTPADHPGMEAPFAEIG